MHPTNENIIELVVLVLRSKVVATLENTFALPRVEFGTKVDVTARISGDIMKPGDKLRNTPGTPEGVNYEKHKMTIFEHF